MTRPAKAGVILALLVILFVPTRSQIAPGIVTVIQPVAANLNATVSGTVAASMLDSAGAPIVPTQCTLTIPFNLTSTGSTEVVAAVGGKVIRLCMISMSTASPVGIKIVQGTGTNCATSPTDLTGVFQNSAGISLDLPGGMLKTTASQALCVNLSGGVNTGGVVSYAQY